jgi:hypothetical protein
VQTLSNSVVCKLSSWHHIWIRSEIIVSLCHKLSLLLAQLHCYSYTLYCLSVLNLVRDTYNSHKGHSARHLDKGPTRDRISGGHCVATINKTMNLCCSY